METLSRTDGYLKRLFWKFNIHCNFCVQSSFLACPELRKDDDIVFSKKKKKKKKPCCLKWMTNEDCNRASAAQRCWYIFLFGGNRTTFADNVDLSGEMSFYEHTCLETSNFTERILFFFYIYHKNSHGSTFHQRIRSSTQQLVPEPASYFSMHWNGRLVFYYVIDIWIKRWTDDDVLITSKDMYKSFCFESLILLDPL